MENKIMQVFYGNDCLPYKDKERQIHYPIVGNAFLGASNTTKIRFYFDYIGNVNTTWVSVAKLPNGKQGSKVLPIASDDNGNYAELELSNWYTQAKGDVYIALQGYQGGVEYSYDSETELYEITGTPTIQTTGSIKLAINYAPIGDSPDYTDEFTTYQEILAALGDKASLESVVLSVDLSDYPTYQELLDYVGTRPFAFVLNDELRFGVFQHDSENDTYALKIFDNSGTYVTDTLNLSDSTSTIEQQIAQVEFATDNIIELTSLMGTLTDKQLQQAVKDNAYIKYNNNYYRKDIDSGTTEFVRFVVGLANNGTSIQIKKTYFDVNTTSGYYIYGETIFDTYTSTWASNLINAKQDRLVSGTNIKTINGQSILGSGDLPIQGGGGASEWGQITGNIQDQTDLQNEFQNVREVAEGKANTFVLSYNDTLSSVKSDIAVNSAKVYDIDGNDITSAVLNGDYDTYFVSGNTFANPLFDSQNDSIGVSSDGNGNVFIFRSENKSNRFNSGYIIYYTNGNVFNAFNIGDNFYIIETLDSNNETLPDRWLGSKAGEALFYKLETGKIDLSAYATKTELAEKSDLSNIAPAYDSSVIYSIGDKVINENGELVTCLVNMTQAEEYDSTHWTQISVASGFVDLDKAQVVKNKILVDSKIKSSENSTYGLVSPDTTNFTANKEIATTDQAFNVINASDITNNTLTQAQYDLITNGKPTLIMGTLGSCTDIFITSILLDNHGATNGFAFATSGAGNPASFIRVAISSSKVISFSTIIDLQASGYKIRSNINQLRSVEYFNNKPVPNYPSSTGTFVLKYVDGILTWVAE